MNFKQLIKFGLENSSDPVIKNPILRDALEPRSMDQAALVDELEPGAFKDEMLGKFDPDQETHEEYLQRINLERPFNMAEGGQLVAPSVDGSRPGFGGRKGSAEDAIKRRTKLADDYNKIVKYALNNRKIKNFSEPVEVTIKGKLTTINELPTVNEWADMNKVDRSTLSTRKGSLIPVKRAEVYKTIVDETIKLNNQTFTYSSPSDIAMDIGLTKNKGRGTGVEDLLRKGNVTKLFSKDEIVSNYIQHLIDKDAPLKDFTNNSIFKHVNSRNADLIKKTKTGSLSIPGSARTIDFNKVSKIMKANHPELFAKLGRDGQIPFLSRSIQNKPDLGNLRLSEAFETTESGDIFFNEAKAKNINLKRALAGITAETDILQGKLKLDQKSLAISNAQDKMVTDLNKYIREQPNVILDNPQFRNLAATRFEDGKFIIDKDPALIDDRLNRYIKRGFFSTDHKISKRTGKLNIEFPTNKQIVPTFINGPIRSMENYIANNISKYDTDPLIKNNIDEIVNVAKTNNFTVNVPKGHSNIFGTNRINVGAIQDIATVSADGKTLTSYDNQLKKFNFDIDKIPEISNVKNIDYTEVDKSKLQKTLDTKLKTAETYRIFPETIRPKGEAGFISRELLEGVGRGAGKGIRIAGKYFGIPDAIFYYIDKQNMISKGMPEKEAQELALKNATFGAYKSNREYMKGLKKTAESMGIDAKAFDNIYKLNVAGQKFDKYYVKAKEEIENLKELGYAKRADDAQKNLDRYMKEQNENLDNLSQKVIDQVSISKAGGAASPLQLSKARDVITQEDYYKPFKDITKVAKEKLKREKRKAFPTQKFYVDTAAGTMGEGFYKAFDALTQGAKNVLQGRIIPYGPERLRPLESERQKEARYLREMEPRELYLRNKARGYTYDQPITEADIMDLRYNQPGVFFSTGGRASHMGGGIASIRRPHAIPPKSGPTPQGLPSMLNRVRRI